MPIFYWHPSYLSKGQNTSAVSGTTHYLLFSKITSNEFFFLGRWEWKLMINNIVHNHIRKSCIYFIALIYPVNSLRPRQNGRHLADDIFKCIFLDENVWIPIKISLKFVPKGPINDIPALVQIMAWRRPGDKPLSEPRLVSLPTHICVTRPQWVNCDLIVGNTLRVDLYTEFLNWKFPSSKPYVGLDPSSIWYVKGQVLLFICLILSRYNRDIKPGSRIPMHSDNKYSKKQH